jgi:hypothetical protein
MHVSRKTGGRIKSSNDLRMDRFGLSSSKYNFNAGYISSNPPGMRCLSEIALMVITAAKFPPAESPSRIIFFF